MNEIQLNANQTSLIVHAKEQYASDKRKTKDIQDQIKFDIDALVESLGWDKKEHKDQIKALKKGFALYAKQQINEERNVFDNAVAVAELGSISNTSL